MRLAAIDKVEHGAPSCVPRIIQASRTSVFENRDRF